MNGHDREAAQLNDDAAEQLNSSEKKSREDNSPQESRELEAELYARPRARGDCKNGPRPCPWVSCRHHLMLDVNQRTGELRENFACLEDMAETCSLDVADRGELVATEAGEAREKGLEKIASLMAAPRTTIVGLRSDGLRKLRRSAHVRQLHEESEDMIAARSGGVRLTAARKQGLSSALQAISEA